MKINKRVLAREREVTCVICGKPFLTRHSQGRYCSSYCRRLGWREQWRKYNRRNKEKRKEISHNHYVRNKENRTKQIEKYRKTERGKLATKQNSINQRAKFPEKYIARHEVYKALAKGILVKQPCETCGELKAEAHHEDYSKPLEVMWLCDRHHRIREGRITEESLIGK